MSTLKSEFVTLTSTSTTDFQPLDLGGARQVVIQPDTSLANGKITNEPYAGSDGFTIDVSENYPLTISSNDDRLYFVSKVATPATIQVWIIRR